MLSGGFYESPKAPEGPGIDLSSELGRSGHAFAEHFAGGLPARGRMSLKTPFFPEKVLLPGFAHFGSFFFVWFCLLDIFFGYFWSGFAFQGYVLGIFSLSILIYVPFK